MMTITTKDLGTIRVTQRTATGNDDSASTTMLLVSYNNTNKAGDIIIDRIEEEQDHLERNRRNLYPVQVLGKVTVIHPWCMVGSWEEMLCSFARRVSDHCKESGAIECNDYGTMFWAGE